ncbi:hypothetical protein FE257_003403 [Aspergillus nanangensis]|uniref:Uncharacterized protein n=1 Tax=Aspergillus nanangensis TaxID=2582783 RepID=A0AAD4CBN4_ASPNN|nr:hypothetical protein FE257_003403 [Aspergillus nanangensis]
MDSNEMLARTYAACRAQQRPSLTATTPLAMSKRYHQALLDPAFALDTGANTLVPVAGYTTSSADDYLVSSTAAASYDLDMADLTSLYPGRDPGYFYNAPQLPQQQQSIFSSSFDTIPPTAATTSSFLPMDDDWMTSSGSASSHPAHHPPTDFFADMRISHHQHHHHHHQSSPSSSSSSRPRNPNANPNPHQRPRPHQRQRHFQTPSPIPMPPTSSSSLTPSPIDPFPKEKDLSNYGLPNPDGTWRCAYPGCTSSTVFRRGCDLRKHYKRHRKHLFCRHEGCPQAVAGGFSSKKDRDRHETKHNPGVECEVPDAFVVEVYAGCAPGNV